MHVILFLRGQVGSGPGDKPAVTVGVWHYLIQHTLLSGLYDASFYNCVSHSFSNSKEKVLNREH